MEAPHAVFSLSGPAVPVCLMSGTPLLPVLKFL